MQLAGPGVFGPPRDHDQAIAVLRRAVELGVDHIDTSQYYGPDVVNELIREALHPYPDDLALVSKVGARRDDAGRLAARRRARAAARGHRGQPAHARRRPAGRGQPAHVARTGPDQHFDDQLDAMVKAREDGLIAGIGLSESASNTCCTRSSTPRSPACRTRST